MGVKMFFLVTFGNKYFLYALSSSHSIKIYYIISLLITDKTLKFGQ
jgi:hypothetical protein